MNTTHRIAIYDLDKTLTRRATYTPFLIYAAWRLAPWRLGWLPVWVGMLIGHKLGLYGRAGLKQAGFALFIGKPAQTRLPGVVDAFAARAAQRLYPGAARQWAADGAGGQRRIIATAALALYAQNIADRLGADALIATPMDNAGRLSEGNNFGDGKYERVLAWFAAQGLARADCTITFYSDHASDGPLLDWADTGVLVNPSARGRAIATQRGWDVADFRDPALPTRP
ncbi:MAG: HAD family hydrolase [Sphingopyxis sp.]